MPRFNLSEITAELVGMEYELGRMDCFGLVIAYLQRRGVALPSEYEGWTLDTYAELYQQDPEQARRVMVEFMDAHFEEVHPNKAGPGDLLLLQLKGGDASPALAISGGNANAVFTTEKEGVAVFPIRHYALLKGWRCPS